MPDMKTQSDEFDAGTALAMQIHNLNNTAIVDDDYPRVRHGYESALRTFVEALKRNGRFDRGNSFGLVGTSYFDEPRRK